MNDCILWGGAKTPAGYGMGRVNGKLVYAHRHVYSTLVEPIATGNVIMHSCDNPSCVNPAHLSQGSQRENLLQMGQRGRQWLQKITDVCGNGHSRASHWVVTDSSHGYCAQCRRDSQRNYEQKRRATR